MGDARYAHALDRVVQDYTEYAAKITKQIRLFREFLADFQKRIENGTYYRRDARDLKEHLDAEVAVNATHRRVLQVYFDSISLYSKKAGEASSKPTEKLLEINGLLQNFTELDTDFKNLAESAGQQIETSAEIVLQLDKEQKEWIEAIGKRLETLIEENCN